MFSHPTVLEPRTPTAPEPHHDLTLKAAAVVGVGGFAVAAVVTGLATPGYDPRREAISGLAALDSPHAWIMILGFLLGAVGLLSAGLVLWKHVPTRAARVGSGLVVISAALIAVAGLARQDCSDQLATCKDFGDAVNASDSYWVHQQASLLGFLLLIISFFLLASGLRRNNRPRLAAVSRVVGVACVAAHRSAGGHAALRRRQLRHRAAALHRGAVRMAGGRRVAGVPSHRSRMTAPVLSAHLPWPTSHGSSELRKVIA